LRFNNIWRAGKVRSKKLLAGYTDRV